MSDVIFQYDHEGRVFARTSNDTLKLTADAHGLEVKAYLGGTEIGRNLYEEIKGGYTSKMSFGFHVNSNEIKEEELDGKTIYTRTIKGIDKLYDVSAVSLPANDGTEISARSLKDGAIAKLEAERLLKAERKKAIEEIKARAAALRKDTK
jgi:HK97 family phage prohead protease